MRRGFAALLAVCLLLFGLVPAGAVQAGDVPTYSSRATVQSGSVAAGQPVAIHAEVTSQVQNPLIVDVEVFDFIGRRLHQEFIQNQEFQAGETKSYEVSFTPALDALRGEYTVRILIFRDDMGSLFDFNGSAAKFSVTEPIGPLYESSASTGVTTATAGDTVSVNAAVKSAVAKEMLVDVEVFDSVGRRVHQQMSDIQSFAAGETKSYSTNFTLPLDALKGTYTVKVGLFGAGMSTMLDWNDSAAQFAVVERGDLYSATATVSADTILAGESVTATAEVRSLVDQEMRVQVTMYDPYGRKVEEQVLEHEQFQAGVARQFSLSWTSPADAPKGDYLVRVGLFATDPNHMYLWNDHAATFMVDRIDPYVASATVTPGTVRPGETAQVVASVRAKETVDALIDIEIYDERSHQVFQQVFDNQHLEAMVPKEWRVEWTPAPGNQGGPYTVKIGVFNPGWGTLYFWQDIAAEFTVDSPVEYTLNVAAPAETVKAGTTMTLDVGAASAGDVDTLVDVEIQNPSGATVYQQYFDNVHLAAGQPVQLPVTWAVPLSSFSGTYNVRVGIFKNGWGIVYYWENHAAQFTVEGGKPRPEGELPPPPQDPRLPGHLGIGLAAYPGNDGLTGWMPQSGVPWDYAYQYLAGGVNTGGGWATWNPNGEFASNYANAAAQNGYIPVFTYYQMLHSYGDCDGCEEPRRDLANLNNAQVMAAYFQDFTLLMQRLAGGGTAIVHVEPDLSGYAQHAVMRADRCFGFCTGQGNDPSLLRAAVSSSGNADVAQFADTWQGFNYALLHLRDLYAPNVLLAFHVSGWGSLQDIGGSTEANMNAWAIGEEIGTFAAKSGVGEAPEGVSTYDLIFNDVSDRDAGFYKYVLGRQNAFWDSTNQSFPNFTRWEEWLTGVVQTVQKPAMVWQIPLGNQYFATMNNTHRHYQDNRAEYFFGHVEELAKVGIVGLLFGSGDNNNTTPFDSAGDGVTNAAPICTNDGNSQGQVCNNHQSTVADDDGGYLRMMGGLYYQEPYVLR